MPDKPAARYAIGFDLSKGPDQQHLTIIDRTQDEDSPFRVRHSSNSWELTAAHLASALDENEKLRGQLSGLAEMIYREINVFQDVVGWQAGDSRNKLIGDIARKMERLVKEAAKAVKEPEA